jgi:transcriptional regulator GlxA family with amidase domain
MVPSPGRRPLQKIAKVARTQLFLSRNISDVPSLKDLAAMTSMSRSHFSRTFHAIAGVTVRDYVRDLRLQHAAALLTGSTLSLTAIAIECGFYDLPHFDKAFHRRFAVSPRAFRRQCGDRREASGA